MADDPKTKTPKPKGPNLKELFKNGAPDTRAPSKGKAPAPAGKGPPPAKAASAPQKAAAPKPAAPKPAAPSLPAPQMQSRALTAPGASGPPAVPPTGRSLSAAAGAPKPPMGAPGAAGNALVRSPGFPEIRPGLGRAAGGLGALGPAVAVTAGSMAVDELAKMRPENIDRTRANYNRPGRGAQVIEGFNEDGAPTGMTSPDHAPASPMPQRHLPPEDPSLPLPPRAPARPAPRPAPRPGMGGDTGMADILNARELARIKEVNAGREKDRPPQFAKGGFLAGKKGVNPFATPAATGKSANPFAKATSGAKKLPAPSVKTPPMLAPKKPGKPPLPFAKGGMPKKPKGC